LFRQRQSKIDPNLLIGVGVGHRHRRERGGSADSEVGGKGGGGGGAESPRGDASGVALGNPRRDPSVVDDEVVTGGFWRGGIGPEAAEV
jgi:hypothetical protein